MSIEKFRRNFMAKAEEMSIEKNWEFQNKFEIH